FHSRVVPTFRQIARLKSARRCCSLSKQHRNDLGFLSTARLACSPMTVASTQGSRQASPLSQPVTVLHGVGKERSEMLKRLDVVTVEDLLLHRPARYEDRRQLRQITELQVGDLAIVRGTIVTMGVKWFRHRTKSIFELVIDDGSARLHCRWWNLPFMEKNF